MRGLVPEQPRPAPYQYATRRDAVQDDEAIRLYVPPPQRRRRGGREHPHEALRAVVRRAYYVLLQAQDRRTGR